MSAAPNAPAPISAQGAVLFPGNLRANPRLSQWLAVLARWHRRGLAGQGRDRPGHPHRARADRRRRARRGAFPRAPRPGDDGPQPERRRHLGQPLGAGLRRRAALRLRRGARASSSPPPPSGSACRKARSPSRTAPSPGPATRARATGSLPPRSRSTVTPPAGPRRSRPPRAASPARPRPASTSPTRCSGSRASSTI